MSVTAPRRVTIFLDRLNRIGRPFGTRLIEDDDGSLVLVPAQAGRAAARRTGGEHARW